MHNSYFDFSETLHLVTPGILLGYILLLPIWIFIVIKHKHTKTVLFSGWTPVLSALFISG